MAFTPQECDVSKCTHCKKIVLLMLERGNQQNPNAWDIAGEKSVDLKHTKQKDDARRSAGYSCITCSK